MKVEYYFFYQVSLIVSMLALPVIVAMLWRHRRNNGVRALIVTVTGLFIWTLGYCLESNSTTLERQNLFNNIAMIGVMAVPSSWLIFTLNYSVGDHFVTRWKIILLNLIPVMVVLVLWNGELRHLIWQSEALVNLDTYYITERTYGSLFWIGVVNNYILIAAGVTILLWKMQGTKIYMYQVITIIASVIIPVIGNALYVFDVLPIMHKDLTPVLFTVSVIIFTFGMSRFGLFKIVPFAHRYIIQQMKESILVFDPTSHLIDANQKAREYLHLSSNDIGKKIDGITALPESLKQLLETKNEKFEVTTRIDNVECCLEIEVNSLLSDNREVGSIITISDITGRKLMQKQMVARDRLVSIGELTAGVAHEINNPLAVIKGIIELTLDRDIPGDILHDMNIANEEIDKASGIVKNLLTFAQSQSDEKIRIDINTLVNETLEILNYKQKQDNIRVVVNLAPNLPEVSGNNAQLSQVLVNIIKNAEFFIMKEGNEGLIQITTAGKNKAVSISISDNGPGMSEERKQHVFDPFYTSKNIGEGTGLGLSICYGIITEHGGSIDVESTPGGGTTFTILLPETCDQPTGRYSPVESDSPEF